MSRSQSRRPVQLHLEALETRLTPSSLNGPMPVMPPPGGTCSVGQTSPSGTGTTGGSSHTHAGFQTTLSSTSGATGASGKADYAPQHGRFDVLIHHGVASTKYTVSVTTNGTTVQVGTLTTNVNGAGRLHLTAGTSFPTIQAGSTIQLTDSAGDTISGTFQSSSTSPS
jgi:hypothetical protein